MTVNDPEAVAVTELLQEDTGEVPATSRQGPKLSPEALVSCTVPVGECPAPPVMVVVQVDTAGLSGSVSDPVDH